MYLPTVLHPDVVDFLRNDLEIDIQKRVWNCIERVKQQQFSSGLRVKKLKGISKRVWEARITDASRLIFTYEKSRQPDTGKAQIYIAVQDICLDHDDVSRIAKARNKTPDAQWLDTEELVEEKIGNLERDRAALTLAEQSALNAAQAEELLLLPDFTDELLGNIQWRVLESESEWHHAIIQQDADLPLKLTPEEYQMAHLPGNLLLSGSAGTGKTTVALYRMLPKKQDSLSGRQLYVAYNPLLVSNAQEQFKRLVGNTDMEIDSIFQFKTLRNLCLEILKTSGQLYVPEDEVNFQVFSELYRAHPQKGKYPAALAWDEIRSIIKGSHLSTGSDLLYKKEYERLGSKRSTVIHQNQRHEVYQLAEWYQKKLRQKEDERFDEIDLARKVLQIVKQGGTKRYQLIVCDEVQDFTELQLELLFQLVASDGNLFFAGDLHQMISPSGFRWEDLKQKFYHAHREVEQKNLNVNFRNVGTLVNLANQLLRLRSRFMGTPVGVTSQSASSYGQLARLITASTESLKDQLQSKLNPGDAILVRTDIDKEKLRSDFQSSFIFTVEETKGLEFDTVFLVEFFKPTQELWSRVLRGSLLKENEKPHLQLELNLLYVAITRARRILSIWESRPSQVWSQRELAGCVLSESAEFVKSERYKPTPESWREQGLYYLKAEFYQQAMECFEKSGDTLLQRKANVKLLVQQRDYNKAAEILAELQEWRDAAQMFERVKQWQQAASCWANADDFQRQQLCEIFGLEAAQQWEDAAQRWEALGQDENAERCRMNIPEKKAERRAIEFEQKGQWLKAAQQYELAIIPKKAAECKAKYFEHKRQWADAAKQYDLAEMSEKAEKCRNNIKFLSRAVETPETPNGNKWKGSLAEGLNQELIDLGVMKIGEDGKCKATEAFKKGRVPGWRYDTQEKVGYMIGQKEKGLRIKFDGEDARDEIDTYNQQETTSLNSELTSAQQFPKVRETETFTIGQKISIKSKEYNAKTEAIVIDTNFPRLPILGFNFNQIEELLGINKNIFNSWLLDSIEQSNYHYLKMPSSRIIKVHLLPKAEDKNGVDQVIEANDCMELARELLESGKITMAARYKIPAFLKFFTSFGGWHFEYDFDFKPE